MTEFVKCAKWEKKQLDVRRQNRELGVVFNWQDTPRNLGVNFEIWVQRRNGLFTTQTFRKSLLVVFYLYLAKFHYIFLRVVEGSPSIKIANLPF